MTGRNVTTRLKRYGVDTAQGSSPTDGDGVKGLELVRGEHSQADVSAILIAVPVRRTVFGYPQGGSDVGK